MAFCPNCGTDVGDSLFCGNCGAKIYYNQKYNQKTNNDTADLSKPDQYEEVHRYKVKLKKVTDPDKKNTEQDISYYRKETQFDDNPELKYYEPSEPEEEHYSSQGRDQFYLYDSDEAYRNSQYDVQDPYGVYKEPYDDNPGVHPKRRIDNSQNGKKSASAKRGIKAATIAILIVLAIAIIGSTVAIGFYVKIKPKADLLVIANATAKTVFQSGSLNFNIDEVSYYNGALNEGTDEAYWGDNYNGCILWGDDVKSSYFYVNVGNGEELDEILKYENGYWKVSDDGYNYETVSRGFPYNSDLIKISNKEFESTTIDENGFESFIDYAIIPYINSEFTYYWESSLDSLTGEQAVKILTDMLSDEYFNENAVKINSKEKIKDGTKYSLTVDLNDLINSCWNYLKESDIYQIILDNSENREEFDNEMNEYFSDFDSFSDNYSYNLDITINSDGYISNVVYSEEDHYDNDVYQYIIEIYNVGIAEKQE